MFCEKCGAKIDDNAKFCIACGAKIETEPSATAVPVETEVTVLEPAVEQPVAEPATEQPAVVSEPVVEVPETVAQPVPVAVEEPEQKPKKKKKKKWPVVLAIILVVIAAAVGVFFKFKDFFIFNTMKLMPAESQFKYVYSQTTLDITENITDAMKSLRKMVKQDETVEGDVKVQLNDGLLTVLKDLSGADFKDVSEAKVNYKLTKNDGKVKLGLGIGNSKATIVNAEICVDPKNNIATLSVPELSDKTVKVDLSTIGNLVAGVPGQSAASKNDMGGLTTREPGSSIQISTDEDGNRVIIRDGEIIGYVGDLVDGGSISVNPDTSISVEGGYSDGITTRPNTGTIEGGYPGHVTEESHVSRPTAATLVLELLSSSDTLVPDEELIEKLIPKYVEIIFNEIDDVERTEEEITASGVTQKVTKFTATINEETVKDMLVAVLEAVKEDEDIKTYFVDAFNELKASIPDLKDEDAQEYWKDACDAIDITIENINEAELEKINIEYVTYVNSNGKIVGIECQAWHEGKEVIDISFLKTENGKDIGISAKVEVQGNRVLEMEGSGVDKNDKFTGEIEIEVMGIKLVELTFDEYGVNESGRPNGTLELKVNNLNMFIPTQGMGDIISETNATIEFNFNSTENSTETVMSIRALGINLGSITVNAKVSEAESISIPSDTTDDIETWAQNMNPEKIIDNAKKAGIYDFLNNMMGGSSNRVESNDTIVNQYDESWN